MDPFFTYLVESYKALDEIQPLTMNEILFEAEDNEKIANISRNNEEKSAKSQNMFMKALTALRSLIQKVVDAIKNFIDYLGLTKDQKAMYKEFRAKVRSNPEFAGKKVTVNVCMNAKKVYGDFIKEAENRYRNGKDIEADVRNQEYSKVLENLKGNLSYAVKSVSLATLCKMIDENEAFAREIEAALMMDKITVNKIEETYGKKSIKKINKHIDAKTGRVGIFKLGITGLIIKARQKESECVGDTLKNLTKDIPLLMKSASAVDKEKTAAIKNDVMDVVKVGGKKGIKGPLKKYRKEHSLTNRIKKKFTKDVDLADTIEDSTGYFKRRKDKDVKESAELIPFHHYYLSDYYENTLNRKSNIAASSIALAGIAATTIAGIVIGAKLSKKNKEKIQKMFRLYEATHPKCIPATEFNYDTYDNNDIKDFKIKPINGTSSKPSIYYIYTDKRNKPVMYAVKIFDSTGQTTKTYTDEYDYTIAKSEELIKPRYEFIVFPSLKNDSTYYRAYMSFNLGVYTTALDRFVSSMKKEIRNAKKSFKESAYDMILEDTEFDIFEDYLESSDDSLIFDEFYKEAQSLELL